MNSNAKDPDALSAEDLIVSGKTQLSNEIKILENWLRDIKQSQCSGINDIDIAATCKSYEDMLRSRREMLSTLSKQALKKSPLVQ
ncbi:MAG: hypothetical protein COC19_05795 [SAR86 cluster bacterium]|uniref:Uncharacterized protein n=1 Tax=SAR86 cluster bacterium TaxID=2030880 RepID=A0A2A4ML35_9GAMM|nr:MAG: hypothetical protein COC19_05795 [SAR86 cluster bacterium]